MSATASTTPNNSNPGANPLAPLPLDGTKGSGAGECRFDARSTTTELKSEGPIDGDYPPASTRFGCIRRGRIRRPRPLEPAVFVRSLARTRRIQARDDGWYLRGETRRAREEHEHVA